MKKPHTLPTSKLHDTLAVFTALVLPVKRIKLDTQIKKIYCFEEAILYGIISK